MIFFHLKKSLFFVFFLFFFVNSGWAEIQNSLSSHSIKVGLRTDVSEVYVRQKGTVYWVQAAGENIRITHNGKSSLKKDFLFTEASDLSVSATKKFSNNYPGSVFIFSRNKSLFVINRTDIESYLQGVVPYEIGSLDSSRFEALKVQAVAARTYAYRHLDSRKSLGFDVYADTRDQVYKGIPNKTSLVSRAIQETEGEIILYENEPIEAYYHSTCGGKTASLSVWKRENLPYLREVEDLNQGVPFCQESSYSSWKVSFAKDKLPELIRNNLKAANVKNVKPFQKIRNFIIEDTLSCGRILILSVLTDNGSFKVYGDKVRFLFKENGKILPSSRFSLKRSGANWILEGSGFGHGIGMCQMGARARAAAGQNYREILLHYYPNTNIGKFHE